MARAQGVGGMKYFKKFKHLARNLQVRLVPKGQLKLMNKTIWTKA